MAPFRRRVRLRLLLLALPVLYILYRLLPGPPSWENNRGPRPPPMHEEQKDPEFTYTSKFRLRPDHKFEAATERSLVEIEESITAQRKKDARKFKKEYTEGPILKIWQTWKDQTMTEDMNQWKLKNPAWEYNHINDKEAERFIEHAFASMPQMINLYRTLPVGVLRADMLRYALLWFYGGLYADVDVSPKRAIIDCPPLTPLLPPAIRTSNATLPSLVVGVEIDEPFVTPATREHWHWSRIYGFIQYTMYAPQAFSPILRRTLVRIMSHERANRKAHPFSARSFRYAEADILEITGPGMFTDAIIDMLSETLPKDSKYLDGEVDEEKQITWRPFHRLQTAITFDADKDWAQSGKGPARGHGGLMVLPINVWGNGQRHSGAGDFSTPEACINHYFGRTWKKGWWEYLFG